MKLIPIPAASQKIALLRSPGYTPAHEVKLLLWLCDRTRGNVVEIGCNNGQTTLEFASRFPDRIIYGVDYKPTLGTEDLTMCRDQRGECPGEIGTLVKGFSNVVLMNDNSQKMDWNVFHDVGFIFIDGDHSYEGVKFDTAKAMEYFGMRPGSGRVIAWHDCYPESPKWCGVHDFVEREMGRWEVKRFEGTMVAYLES